MKRFASVLLVLIITVITSFGVVQAGAVGATTGEIDVVFLVDSSRSMEKSDPDFIRLEAIKLFADLCTLEHTKIGFVLFGNEINYSQTPIPIDTETDRAALKKTVNSLGELKGETDIGKAVLYTVNMLASDEYSGNGKFIVFLSDGRTAFSKNEKVRTREDSEKDLTSGIIAAKNAGIPIYTIGLNAKGDVDEPELNRISAETYADKTYMTDSASNLSEILSSIYVRHTGAETKVIENFTSDGEYHDVNFAIDDSSVVEANLVIMHSGGLDDVKLYDTAGNEVAFGDTGAAISRNENYSLIKIYYPQTGSWKLSVKSPKDTQVDVNYILTRDYRIDYTLYTNKAVSADTNLKFIATLTDPNSEPITDNNVLEKLIGKGIVRNEDTGESWDIPLTFENGKFRGEYQLTGDGTYTAQVSLYNTNIDIRSDIITLAPGEEAYIEPEGPLKLILIIAGSVLAVALIVFLFIKHQKDHIRMYSGRLAVMVSKDGVTSMPAYYDFAKKAPGRRKVMLTDVVKALYESSDRIDAIPRAVISGVSISMTESGDVRFSNLGDVEYSGGITLGRNVILSNANRLTVTYSDKTTGSRNMLVIQYLRT